MFFVLHNMWILHINELKKWKSNIKFEERAENWRFQSKEIVHSEERIQIADAAGWNRMDMPRERESDLWGWGLRRFPFWFGLKGALRDSWVAKLRFHACWRVTKFRTTLPLSHPVTYLIIRWHFLLNIWIRRYKYDLSTQIIICDYNQVQ